MESRNTKHFCIADTFTDSLTKLTGDEQKSAKITACGFQFNLMRRVAGGSQHF